ncbi:hypothetical protein ASE73_00035 [Sphingomonas sp. Leaf24]|nr:hypothetical protein ASE50_00035 [Sphingomonas sp. Leaf5]KQM95541.1 hypothetical protein ASE73_00035 [Sphingomonas sp. Leaf24]
MGAVEILPGTARGTSRRLVEGSGHERCDRIGHRVGIRHDPPGSNPHNAIALSAQKPQSVFVPIWMIGTVMYVAVDFHDQPRFPAIEIDNIGSDRMLAAKLRTRVSSTQLLPQHRCGVREVAAQATGDRHFRA